MEKALLMLNPRSGTREGRLQFFSIVNTLSKKYEVCVHITKSTEDIIETASRCEYKTVIACGGDGTLSHTIEGLMLGGKEDVNIGYIPCGTANDVASTHQIPKKPSDSAEKVCSGKVFPCDVGSFNGMHFVYIASFGAFTKASYETSQDVKNMFGNAAYFLNGIGEILNLQSIEASIECESGVYNETDIVFCAATNTRSIGGGVIKYSKDMALLDDGKLELLIIRKPKNVLDFEKIVREVVGGTFGGEYVTLLHGSKFKITTKEPLLWTVDGDGVKAPSEVTLECVNKGINLIL